MVWCALTIIYFQEDIRLRRCYFHCYRASKSLLEEHVIRRANGPNYEIKCMVSAFHTINKEAHVYLEVEKIKESVLKASIKGTGATEVDIVSFSCNMPGTESKFNAESASSLFKVHSYANEHGFVLIQRGVPSVQPKEMQSATRSQQASVEQETNDILVQEQVMRDDPEAFQHDGGYTCPVLGKQKMADRAGSPTSTGAGERKRQRGSLVDELDAKLQQMDAERQRVAELRVLAVENETLKSTCGEQIAQISAISVERDAALARIDAISMEMDAALDAKDNAIKAAMDAKDYELKSKMDEFTAMLNAKDNELKSKMDEFTATLNAKDNELKTNVRGLTTALQAKNDELKECHTYIGGLHSKLFFRKNEFYTKMGAYTTMLAAKDDELDAKDKEMSRVLKEKETRVKIMLDAKDELLDIEQNKNREGEERYGLLKTRYMEQVARFTEIETRMQAEADAKFHRENGELIARVEALHKEVNIAGDMFVDQVDHASTESHRKEFCFVCYGQLPDWKDYSRPSVSYIHMVTVDDLHLCKIVFYGADQLKKVNFSLQRFRQLQNFKTGGSLCIGMVARTIKDPRNLWIQEELKKAVSNDTVRTYVPPGSAAAGGANAAV